MSVIRSYISHKRLMVIETQVELIRQLVFEGGYISHKRLMVIETQQIPPLFESLQSVTSAIKG